METFRAFAFRNYTQPCHDIAQLHSPALGFLFIFLILWKIHALWPYGLIFLGIVIPVLQNHYRMYQAAKALNISFWDTFV
ncbi:MAG: hypothetical protein U0Y10_01425 [Spirosomataceae bacterium]